MIERPARADAIRNRATVLAAAEEVFSERGSQGSIEEVAQRAGLGVGTVCRHYANKHVLLQAVLDELYTTILSQAEAALDDPDGGRALEAFLVELSDFVARHRVLAEQPTAVGSRPESEALRRVIEQLVGRAQAEGAIRTDIGPADVVLLVSGAAHATAQLGGDPSVRDRYLKIVLAGLRPPDRPPAGDGDLPGRPLTFPDIDRLKEHNPLPDSQRGVGTGGR